MSAEQGGDEDLSTQEVSIDRLCDLALLKTIWKNQVRRHLRAARLADFYLAVDALQFAAYEWNLDDLLTALMRDIRSGDYLPERAEIIWSAKKNGMSRPLAFLEPRDALLYRALVTFVQPDLLTSTRLWTSYRRDEQGNRCHFEQVDSEDNSYPDWFAIWKDRQGAIATMSDNYPYIVESDIANYFPTIDRPAVAELFLSITRLSRDAVRLLMHLLRLIQPHVLFSEVPHRGLPQENLDSSRTIAHSLLIQVDSEFDQEGQEGRYSRYMDDIILAVNTEEEGFALVNRIQRSLHQLGLYPNTSKTRVVSSEQFIADQMFRRNADLEEIDHRIKALIVERRDLKQIESIPPDLLAALHAVWQDHTSDDSRPRNWDRVLRRLYTLYRQVRDDSLLSSCADHIWEYPDGARHFLEYARSFPLSQQLVDQLARQLQRTRNLYEDIPLLIAETIATAPVSRLLSLHAHIAHTFVEIVRRELPAIADPLRSRLASRIAGAASVVIGKFGSDEHFIELHKLWCSMPPDSLSRLQALPILAGNGLTELALDHSTIAGLPWRSSLNLDFLRALSAGDQRATGVALGLIKPEHRLMPQRWMVQVRGTLLLPLLLSAGDKRLGRAIQTSHDRLLENPSGLRDERTEWLLHRSLGAIDATSGYGS